MRRLAALVVLALLATVAPAAAQGEDAVSTASTGSRWFEPDTIYRGNFPDPSVYVEGGTAYAYSTATGGAYLPVMTSTDLSTWRARSAYRPSPYPDPTVDEFFNDALVEAPSWALPVNIGHNHIRAEIIAPGVARIGGAYRAYYAVKVGSGSRLRYCISVATASSPIGPFRDESSGPLVCSSDPVGSIDPDPFVAPNGRAYLTWKNEGVPGLSPTKIYSRELNASGTGFAPGSRAALLLQTAERWEGNVVENPSMVYHQGRYLLFYSGNEWQSRDYAVGVARCSGPLGPCTRIGDWPILTSRSGDLGPGGADAFVAADGKLRIAYHAWRAPHTSYDGRGQRYLNVEAVETLSDGSLAVGGASTLTVGFSDADWANLVFAANKAGVTPEYLTKFGVFALTFIVKLSGHDTFHQPVSPRPATDGPRRVTVAFSAGEERVISDWLADHYLLAPNEVLMAGAAFQIFLAAVTYR